MYSTITWLHKKVISRKFGSSFLFPESVLKYLPFFQENASERYPNISRKFFIHKILNICHRATNLGLIKATEALFVVLEFILSVNWLKSQWGAYAPRVPQPHNFSRKIEQELEN